MGSTCSPLSQRLSFSCLCVDIKTLSPRGLFVGVAGPLCPCTHLLPTLRLPRCFDWGAVAAPVEPCGAGARLGLLKMEKRPTRKTRSPSSPSPPHAQGCPPAPPPARRPLHRSFPWCLSAGPGCAGVVALARDGKTLVFFFSAGAAASSENFFSPLCWRHNHHAAARRRAPWPHAHAHAAHCAVCVVVAGGRRRRASRAFGPSPLPPPRCLFWLLRVAAHPLLPPHHTTHLTSTHLTSE